MSEVHKEILMNIPDEDLNDLAKMYKGYDAVPYASSIITNGIKIRQKRSCWIKFMSPGNCWREDGTFFALMEFPQSYELAVFTLDKSCKNVYEALMKTKRLHFERPLGFFAIHEDIYPTILRVLKDKKLIIRADNPYYLYSISKDKAIHFEIECPEEVEIKRLDPSHADLINSLWPLKFPDSQEFLAGLIEVNGGFGLFLKSNDELVSWTIKIGIGQLGILQTVESHKKNGYASIVTKKLSKEIAEDGENPTGTIGVENWASQHMFKKLGFENIGLSRFISLK